MTDDPSTENSLFTDPLVYQLPYAGNVREGISYADDARIFDLYLPEKTEGPAPVVC